MQSCYWEPVCNPTDNLQAIPAHRQEYHIGQKNYNSQNRWDEHLPSPPRPLHRWTGKRRTRISNGTRWEAVHTGTFRIILRKLTSFWMMHSRISTRKEHPSKKNKAIAFSIDSERSIFPHSLSSISQSLLCGRQTYNERKPKPQTRIPQTRIPRVPEVVRLHIRTCRSIFSCGAPSPMYDPEQWLRQ